ncbi:hypothetical protein MKW94_014626 [Papaver nudicaule]|uniref:Uncharacterized protein n=1 Tax=Papaver nudicaule TaxID=74823 RepID=A0AA42AZX0_PAPNU|nr:hypothetical protein [Papaver nudicaule]
MRRRTGERCLEGGPDAAERRPGSGFPTGRGTEDDHLEAHHDLTIHIQNRYIFRINEVFSVHLFH